LRIVDFAAKTMAHRAMARLCDRRTLTHLRSDLSRMDEPSRTRER
jgi:hypothetical protein